MNCSDCKHFQPDNLCRHPGGADGKIAFGATALRMSQDLCGPDGKWFELSDDEYTAKCIARGMDAEMERHDPD